MASLKLFVLLAVVIAAVAAQNYAPTYSASDYKPAYKSDYKPSYAKGNVKIQVYRGPDSPKGYDKGGYGYDDGAFAPWGYYVTQPEDDKPYGYH